MVARLDLPPLPHQLLVLRGVLADPDGGDFG